MVQYVLAHNYDLLEGRHPDQLVIAAVYGVCKIHSTDVTFKDLVQAYKTIAATSSNMWLAVPLVRPGSFGNIIAFYNDVRALLATARAAPRTRARSTRGPASPTLRPVWARHVPVRPIGACAARGARRCSCRGARTTCTG